MRINAVLVVAGSMICACSSVAVLAGGTSGGTGGMSATAVVSSGSSTSGGGGAGGCETAKGEPGGWESVAAGDYHTCAIKVDQSLWCWGHNEGGALGDGTFADRYSPIEVKTLGGGWLNVAAGSSHTCAIALDHTLWCWGRNDSGQLGDGSTNGRPSPGQVKALGDDVELATTGRKHTCATKISDGSLWCWGDNQHGQLGDGSTTGRLSPVAVTAFGSIGLAMSAGQDHTCAGPGATEPWCWGANDSGQLGDGAFTDSASPVKVGGLGFGPQAVSASHKRTCAITAFQGALWCWGFGFGAAPVQAMGIPAVVEVHQGDSFICARAQSDSLWCWGTGYGTSPAEFCALGGDVRSFSTGAYHACAIKNDKSLWCWGANDSGQLGDGTIVAKSTPVQIH